ncbi:hypothetical protein AB0K48_11205 [Nonomuraea sp. NPDC055795]
MTMRIAVSGHRGLPAAVEQQVDRLSRNALTELGDQGVTGLSCIADGADTCSPEPSSTWAGSWRS